MISYPNNCIYHFISYSNPSFKYSRKSIAIFLHSHKPLSKVPEPDQLIDVIDIAESGVAEFADKKLTQ